MKVTPTTENEAFGNYTAYDDHFDTELADVLNRYRRPSRTVALDQMFKDEEDEGDN